MSLFISSAGRSSSRPRHAFSLAFSRPGTTIRGNNTRQGYARKRTLKPAGYFFLGSSQGARP